MWYYNHSDKLKIISCDSIDAIAAYNPDSGSNTIFKVGEDYYTYFTSTGSVEPIVRTMSGYDSSSLDVINNLYTTKISTLPDTSDSASQKLEDITTFNNVLTARLEYLYKELDNCEANLQLDPNNADWLTYKNQLENEITSILTYRTAVSSMLNTLLASVDADASLTQDISKLLDSTTSNAASDYNYSKDTNNETLMAESLSELQTTLANQQTLLDSLSSKYADLNDLIISKRENLDSLDLTDSAEYNQLITYLDNSIANYIEDSQAMYNDLNTRVTALENISNTLDSDTESAKEVYNELKQQQQTLEEQVKYLKTLIESTSNTSSNDGTSEALTAQLDEQQKQLDTLNDVLNSETLTKVETLIKEQTEIYNYIDRLQAANDEASQTLSAEQLQELEDLRNELSEMITNSITGVSAIDYDYLFDIEQRLNNKLNSISDNNSLQLRDLQDTVSRNTANTTQAINNTVDTMYYELNNTITTENERMDTIRETLTTLINESSEQSASDLADAIASLSAATAALDSNTQSHFQALSTTMLDQDTVLQSNIDVLSQLISQQQQDLQDRVAELKSSDDEINAAISDLSTALDTAKSDIATRFDTDEANFDALKQSYEDYVTTTNACIEALNSVLILKANEDSTYESVALSTLNTQLTALKNSYEQYALDTTTALNALDTYVKNTLATAVAANTDSISANATNITANADAITALQTRAAAIEATATANVTALEGKISSALTEAKSYTDGCIKTINESLGDRVTSLESVTATNAANITSLQNTVNSMKTTINSLKYTLPTASTTTLGGVKVDGTTVQVDSNGVLYVNTANVGGSSGGGSSGALTTSDEVKVGTVWSDYDDIPSAYRDYCIQFNYVNLTSTPETLYKVEEETWYAYSVAFFNTSANINAQTENKYPTKISFNGSKTGVNEYTYKGYYGDAWYLSDTRPTSYKACEPVTVDVYYYGYEDPTSGQKVWTEYTVLFDFVKETTLTYSSYTVSAKFTCTGATHDNEGNITSYSYSMEAGTEAVVQDWTPTTPSGNKPTTVTVTWLSDELEAGNYAKYGPESGYIIPLTKSCNIVGTLTQSQRIKMEEAGVFTKFYPLYYDMTIAATASNSTSQIKMYTTCVHNLTEETSAYGSYKVSNEETLECIPADLTEDADTTTSKKTDVNAKVGLQMPYNVFNFTEAGIAYKLVYLYGNHCWMYVGTP